MPLLFEITAADGTVTRVAPERGLARVAAEPGARYRLVDETGRPIGPGARVLRYENDLVIADLPGEDTFEIANFFSACTPQTPCQFSLAEIGGAPGEVISPLSSPAAALTEGGFLMAAPGVQAQALPAPPESDFNWKPIAGIAGGLAIAGAGLGGGGGGSADVTPPSAPTIKTTVTNDPTPVISGTAEPGSQVTITLNPGGGGSLVTFSTTTDGSGNWAIDTGSATPTAGTMPAGGLPLTGATTVDLVARDASGNLSSVTSGTVTIDVTPPDATAALTGISDDVAPLTGILAQDASTNDNTPRITGTLDQALAAGDRVQVLRDGAVIGEATVNGLSWSFTDGPLGDSAALIAYGARVADAAGNTSAEAGPARIRIDTVAPDQPTLAVVAGNDIISKPEADAGVTVSGTTAPNGTVRVDWGGGAREVTADSQGTFSTVFQAADLPADGERTLSAIAVDAAGNQSNPGTRTVTVDRTEPSLTITGTAAPGATINGTETLTLTFSEPVSGFTIDDVTVGGGASAAAFDTVNASTYTVGITPPAGGNGTATVSVAAAAALDAAGNPSTAANFSRAFDTLAPTPTITDNFPGAEATGAVTFTFNFGEEVTGFGAGDITVANGTAGAFTGSSGDAVYTLVVTPTPNDSGTMTVSVGAGAATDAAGNDSQPASGGQAFNTSRPTVTIAPTGGAVSPPPNGPFEYTITFSEPVTGLTLGDIIVVNGSDSNLAGSGAVYTFDATPAAGFEGNLQVNIGANAVIDAGGNGNLAGSSAPQAVDTVAPSLTITDNVAGTTNGAVTYTFTFSETVTGFTAGDITVTGGTPSAFGGSGAVYQMTVTPPAGSTTPIDLAVGAGIATDASGNGNTGDTDSQPVDTVPPTLVITADPADPGDGSVRFVFDFGEDVTGFELGDIDVTSSAGALTFTLGALDVIGGGTDNFDLTVTPADGTSGTLTVTVAAGVATDAAGNPNTADGESQVFTTPGAFLPVIPNTLDPLGLA